MSVHGNFAFASLLVPSCPSRSPPAIKSCRPAKTPSEFYLSFHPSSYPPTMEEVQPLPSVFPSRSSGDQTLIGLDSVFCSSPPPVLRNPRFPRHSFVRMAKRSHEHIVETVFLPLEYFVSPCDTSAIGRQDKWRTQSVPYDTCEFFDH